MRLPAEHDLQQLRLSAPHQLHGGGRLTYTRTTTATRRAQRSIRIAYMGGTYNAGRNAAKRANRRADIRARVAARAAR